MAIDVPSLVSSYLVPSIIIISVLLWLLAMLYRRVHRIRTDMQVAVHLAYASFGMVSALMVFVVFLCCLLFSQSLLRLGLEALNYTILVATFVGSIILAYDFSGALREERPPAPHVAP